MKLLFVKSVDSDAAAASCLLFLFFWELSQCVVVHVYSPLPSGNKNWTLNLTTYITFLNPTGQSFLSKWFYFTFPLFCSYQSSEKNWPVENIRIELNFLLFWYVVDCLNSRPLVKTQILKVFIALLAETKRKLNIRGHAKVSD